MKTTQTKAGERSISQRKNIYMNRRVKELLGAAYSWEDELYYFGNPCVAGATEFENRAVAAIERNWNEAIRA